MIKLLKLERWRAYEYSEIPFDAGTTFVVAANGIGKTSLLEAAQFALTGVYAGETSPVMLGRADATVELKLELAPGTDLVIFRTLLAGETVSDEVTVTKNGKVLSGEKFATELDAAFGTTAEFIAHNAFLCDSLTDVGPLDVRSLLTRAFLLDQRRADAEQLDSVAASLESEAVELSRSIRSEARELGRLEKELELAVVAETAAGETVVAARAAMDRVTVARAEHLQNAALVEQVDRWEAAAAGLFETARVLIPSVTQDRLVSEVEDLVVASEGALVAVRADAAAAQARIELIDVALSDLDAAGSDCPVCRRPLGDEDRAAAIAEHVEEARRLRDALAQLDVSAASAQVDAARLLLRQVDALGPRPDGPPPGFVPQDPQAQFDSARSDLERAVSEFDAAKATVVSLTDAVAEVKAGEERSALSERAWRRWALTDAAARALHKSIDDVLREEVIPVQEAVAQRWNSLFPDRPELHFDLDGRQWRKVGEHQLPLNAFSAGERTAARLLMQLAILTAVTKVSFCWLDEPLEHLDPRTRRLVAGMLSDASRATGLEQLVVTTYEVDLASQLHETADNTSIEWVRAGPMEQPQPD